ncbi:MAG: LacI family DNA-binding transcriptional regulator [Deltaproteobacteria bacterium]|nr:LacI family DNA-binding transcriptional regulator [Deltaproteobacteria bacterium]
MASNIEEIAKMAGVSKTTVSMVMNGKAAQYGINQETAEKIKKIAQKFHYVPNNMARGLRLQRIDAFGLIVPDLNNWFFSQLAHSLENVLRKKGFRLYVTSSHYDEEAEYKNINDLISWHVDGLIVASVMRQDKITKEFSSLKIPVVYVDRIIESEKISWISSDNFQGAYDLVSYLCSKGVKEVYYLGGERTVSTLMNRVNGYKKALEDHKIPYRSEYVFEKGSTPDDAYELMKIVYKKCRGFPEAMFLASCDYMTGILRFFKETNDAKIPPKFLVGTFDNEPLLDFLSVKIPSVQQDTEAMAEAAVSIIEQVQQGVKDVKPVLVKPKLIIR